MAKLSDHGHDDHEEEYPVTVLVFLVMAFAAMIFIAGMKYDRAIEFLGAASGIGLLVGAFAVYALLSTRRHQQREQNGRRVAKDVAAYPMSAFEDEEIKEGRLRLPLNNARSV